MLTISRTDEANSCKFGSTMPTIRPTNTKVGTNNFGPWACHLASEKFLSFAVAIQASIAPDLCGMENLGLGFVRYQIPNLQETSWDLV